MTLNMPYEKVVEKIIAETELSKVEVEKRINEKVNELGGLITLEGAAHIIARELEINLYDSQQMQKPQPTKISDLMDGMNNVTITALVKNIYEPKTFTKKDGTQGAVQNALLVDKSDFCRLVLWDDQIRQFKDFGLARGDLIRITGAFVKISKYDQVKEIGLGSRSQIDTEINSDKKDEFPSSLLEHCKIETLKIGQVDLEILGKIIAIRPASKFNKKDGSEGTVASLELADETGKTRVTLWDQIAENISNFKINDVVEIIGGYTRTGMNNSIEVHLGKNGSITKKTKINLSIPKEILESATLINTGSQKSKEPIREVRLSELDESMSNISIIARITGISEIREFQRKDGTTSVVGSLLVIDNSGSGRITLWNSMAEYIKKVDIGDVIRVEGAYVRLGLRNEPEVHIGRNTTIEINPEYLSDAIPKLEINYIDIGALEPKKRDVNIKAMVMRVQELRTFSKKDGSEGHVLNIGLSDNTGSTRMVAWDEKAIELEQLEEMTPIEILHGYTKEGMQGVEVHLGTLSTIRKLSKEDSGSLSNITPQEKNYPNQQTATRVDMVDLEENQFSEIRGTILKVYEGKMYYNSCPECRKKVQEDDGTWVCNEHGEVNPEQTIFLSIALDDGTGCVRVTFFRELAENLSNMNSSQLIDEIENAGIQSTITKLDQRLKGREIIVRGRSRKNKFDDGMDVIASTFFDMDSKSEIEQLKESLEV